MDGRTPARVRHSSSQYDFVKVRVWLGESEDRHVTVLSRFVLCRTLTAAKVPYDAAVKVALEVKKTLVDGDLLDVSQAQLEGVIFRVMRKRAFGDDFVSRYRMLTAFHMKRAPLVVLICGSVCTGKSTIAAKLSQRLNLPNTVQTDVVCQVLRSSENNAGVHPLQLWDCGTVDVPTLMTAFEAECAAVCKGLDGLLRKCLTDGKALVVEGLHCHAAVYTSRIQELLSENAEGSRQCQPVVVPIAVRMNDADRELLLQEWVRNRGGRECVYTVQERVSSLDAAVLASGAYVGALSVQFNPAAMCDALGLVHEHVLCRVKECVSV